MQKRLTIALDIDGTLIDKKGKLDPNVYELFQKADLERTNFVLMTGNSADNAFDCIDQINAILPQGKSIEPWISASCGSTIIDPKGNTINDANIDTNFIKDVIARAEQLDPKVIFMYRHGKDNLIEKQNLLSKNGILMYLYKYKEAKKGSAGIQFTDLNKKDRIKFITENNIQNVFTVSLNKEAKPQIDKEIQKIADKYSQELDRTYPVYPGFATQTPARSKADALKIILDKDKDMCKDIADVIYFGDGTNDVECLSICKYSFARGPEAKEKAKEVAEYTYNNLSSVADALFCDENDFDSSMANLPATEVTQQAELSR